MRNSPSANRTWLGVKIIRPNTSCGVSGPPEYVCPDAVFDTVRLAVRLDGRLSEYVPVWEASIERVEPTTSQQRSASRFGVRYSG